MHFVTTSAGVGVVDLRVDRFALAIDRFTSQFRHNQELRAVSRIAYLTVSISAMVGE